jgi:hypothetical protein
MGRGGPREGAGKKKTWETVENPEEEMTTIWIPRHFKEEVLDYAHEIDRKKAREQASG